MTLYRASFLRIILLVSSRFGEAIELAKEKMDQKNIYLTNPAFDTGKVNG